MSLNVDISTLPEDNVVVTQLLSQIQTLVSLDNTVINSALSKLNIDGTTFSQLVDLGLKVDGLMAWFEKPLSFLDELVPESFPNSTVYIGEEEQTPVQKAWKDYCLYLTNDTNCLLLAGWRNSDGNRPDIVYWDELKLWLDYFGSSELWALSWAEEKINSEYNNYSGL